MNKLINMTIACLLYSVFSQTYRIIIFKPLKQNKTASFAIGQSKKVFNLIINAPILLIYVQLCKLSMLSMQV